MTAHRGPQDHGHCHQRKQVMDRMRGCEGDDRGDAGVGDDDEPSPISVTTEIRTTLRHVHDGGHIQWQGLHLCRTSFLLWPVWKMGTR